MIFQGLLLLKLLLLAFRLCLSGFALFWSYCFCCFDCVFFSRFALSGAIVFAVSIVFVQGLLLLKLLSLLFRLCFFTVCSFCSYCFCCFDCVFSAFAPSGAIVFAVSTLLFQSSLSLENLSFALSFHSSQSCSLELGNFFNIVPSSLCKTDCQSQ